MIVDGVIVVLLICALGLFIFAALIGRRGGPDVPEPEEPHREWDWKLDPNFDEDRIARIVHRTRQKA